MSIYFHHHHHHHQILNHHHHNNLVEAGGSSHHGSSSPLQSPVLMSNPNSSSSLLHHHHHHHLSSNVLNPSASIHQIHQNTLAPLQSNPNPTPSTHSIPLSPCLDHHHHHHLLPIHSHHHFIPFEHHHHHHQPQSPTSPTSSASAPQTATQLTHSSSTSSSQSSISQLLLSPTNTTDTSISSLNQSHPSSKPSWSRHTHSQSAHLPLHRIRSSFDYQPIHKSHQTLSQLHSFLSSSPPPLSPSHHHHQSNTLDSILNSTHHHHHTNQNHQTSHLRSIQSAKPDTHSFQTLPTSNHLRGIQSAHPDFQHFQAASTQPHQLAHILSPQSQTSTRFSSSHSRFDSILDSDHQSISVSCKGAQFGLSLADFEVICTLGTGTFGKVLLVRLRHRPSQYYAMKVLAKVEVVRLKQVEHMNSEKDLLALVSAGVGHHPGPNPFCVTLVCTFQDERNLYMMLEFVQGGELFSHLRRAGRFTADVARFFAANVLLALQGLHELDIVYRDLKPENILLGPNGYVKLTDFGFAKKVPDRTWTLCGTPEYLAPEIIQSKGHGKPADWWAFGVLLYEMLAGFPPFFSAEGGPFGIYEKILACDLAFPNHVDPLAEDLVRRLLTPDRSKRLGNLKGGAMDVRAHGWFAGVDWEALGRQAIRAPILPRIGLAGDSSNFEKYPEVRMEELPGMMRAQMNRHGGQCSSPEVGADPYGHLFESF